MEDLTDPETLRLDQKCDRTVSLYGYLRGTYLKKHTQVHIPGKAGVGLLSSVKPSSLLHGAICMRLHITFLMVGNSFYGEATEIILGLLRVAG